ncbi:hypothetical protein M0R45_031601 [Rubus argutus]|uniref:Uncharacterized protein n=1 Tax=Rubus argutus TaxID=59490 RepID=A0AAW1WEH1_RUBAR
MGPEKHNRVCGYGVGVNWSDIPGIVTENTGITQKIQALKDVYEAQREEYEKREAEMTKQLKEAVKREKALQANYVALNSKMDAIQGQVGANSLGQILAACGIDSMESLDFGRILNLLKKPENSQHTSQTNVQLTLECQDAGNEHNGRLCST